MNRREERMKGSEGGRRGRERGREILSYYETNNISDVSKSSRAGPLHVLVVDPDDSPG